MTIEEIPNGEANAARDQLIRTAQRAHQLEITLVAFTCAVGLILVITIAVGIWKLQDYARINRRLGEQNSQLLKTQEQSSSFGVLAVQCVLANFAEHRYTNQEVHDGIAKALGIPLTPHTPLPMRYSEEEFTRVCAPFGGHP